MRVYEREIQNPRLEYLARKVLNSSSGCVYEYEMATKVQQPLVIKSKRTRTGVNCERTCRITMGRVGSGCHQFFNGFVCQARPNNGFEFSLFFLKDNEKEKKKKKPPMHIIQC
jgi:hypothetical protein